MRFVLGIGILLATMGFVAAVPPVAAHCTVNVGSCYAGGGCDVNLLGTCSYYGECPVNVLGTCTNGGECTVTMGTCNGGRCTVTIGTCGPSGRCLVSYGYCNSAALLA